MMGAENNSCFRMPSFVFVRPYFVHNIFHFTYHVDCVLYAVGKPVYHKFTDQTYGSWLKDPLPKNDDIGERIWTTNESDTLHVYEYANKAKYRNNTPRLHKLKPPGFRVSGFFKNQT